MKSDTIYFYTASILDWKCILNINVRRNIILDSLKHLVKEDVLKVYAFIIMPNHIHLIWKPLLSKKVKNVQLSFMKFTSQQILFNLKDSNYHQIESFLVNKRDRPYQIWQRNPLAIEVYSRKVIEQKLDYIHNNPVQGKWMLASSPIEYGYSSATFYENDDLKYSFLTHYMEDV